MRAALTPPSAEASSLLLPEAPLAGAGFAFGRMTQRPWRDAVGIGDSELVFLQPADLVA